MRMRTETKEALRASIAARRLRRGHVGTPAAADGAPLVVGRVLCRAAVCDGCGTALGELQRRLCIRCRFDSHVERGAVDACWIWTARSLQTANAGGVLRRPAVIAWELANGSVPTGLDVRHRCGTGRCVNPAHLFVEGWVSCEHGAARRDCRACKNARQRAWQTRNMAEGRCRECSQDATDGKWCACHAELHRAYGRKAWAEASEAARMDAAKKGREWRKRAAERLGRPFVSHEQRDALSASRRAEREALRRVLSENKEQRAHELRCAAQLPCSSCRQTKPREAFFRSDPETCKVCHSIAYRRAADALRDAYVRKMISKNTGLRARDIPPVMLEAKRVQIAIKRLLRKS